jgi:hypothetical protein
MLSQLLSPPNYISRLSTSTGVCHIYRDNIIGISNDEFEIILNPQFYYNHITEASKLVSEETNPFARKPHQSIDKRLVDFFEHDRKIITDAIIFIHTWYDLYGPKFEHLISANYDTYSAFFEETLRFIINQEHDPEIIDMARDLLESIQELNPSLNPYAGNFKDHIFKTETFIHVMALLSRLSRF